MSEKNNQARITGIIEEEFQYSHNRRVKEFYKTKVRVKRLSGTIDHVPIIVSNSVIPNISNNSFKGEQVEIKGQFRSSNLMGEDGKYHLILRLYVEEIIFFGKGKWDDVIADENFIFLDGHICKEPLFRRTLAGSQITEMMLAVNRSIYKTDYIPCIAWNGMALYARKLEVGDRIQVKGRIQSREYFKRYSPDSEDGEFRTAYEISCISVKKVNEYF